MPIKTFNKISSVIAYFIYQTYMALSLKLMGDNPGGAFRIFWDPV